MPSTTRLTAMFIAASRIVMPSRSAHGVDLLEPLAHPLGQTLFDLGERHLFALRLLRVFQVGDEHAAGVAENVGDDERAAAVEDLVGLGRGRGVGAFGDDPGLDAIGVLVGDLRARRRRESGCRSRFRARPCRRSSVPPAKPRTPPVALTCGQQGVDVQAVRVDDAAGDVGDGDDPGAVLRRCRRRPPSRRCRSPARRRAARRGPSSSLLAQRRGSCRRRPCRWPRAGRRCRRGRPACRSRSSRR